MAWSHGSSPLQALYRVFVLPALSQPHTKHYPNIIRLPLQSSRLLSTTTRLQSKTRAPEQRSQKWDSEIRSQLIYLVPPDTNRLIDPETGQHIPPVTLRDTLVRLDTKTHRLIQLSPEEPGNPNFIPACKIVSKKDAYESEKKRKLQQKEQKKVQKVVTEAGQKTIELNWAIAEGDLAHRLGRLQQFLEEGRRVEIVLAGKKRGRRASLEECENVMRRVRETVEAADGAKEKEAWHGKMGGFMNVVFQGKPPKSVPIAVPSELPSKENGETIQT